MSKVTVYADVRARLLAANLGVPISWPNELFALPATPAPYLLVELSGGASRPAELGGSMWLSLGQVWVHVLVPINIGTDQAFALSDQISAVFRGPPFDAVTYTEISDDPGSFGDGNGNYWRTSVSADWQLQTYVQGA